MKIVRENPDGMTLEKIGEVLGITRERVRQIELNALAKLRRGREAGAGEVVELKGRLTEYAFALVECESCGEFFVRDGATSLCPECESEPIPLNMPSVSLVEFAARKAESSGSAKGRRLFQRPVETARDAVLEGFFGCFELESAPEPTHERMIHITLGRLETITVEEETLNLGRRELVEKLVPNVIMWLTYGEPKDVKRAEAFAAEELSTDPEPWEVFTFPTTERDPFEATKRILVERIDS